MSAVFLLVHAGRQVLEVDLVHDADARRHHLEGVESLHAPFHELVALLVALEFELLVQVERVFRAVVIDLHRVDRKSTRLNSSHEWISYAVFCLKTKTAYITS